MSIWRRPLPARAFGERFGNGDAAWLCGLFHDIGKFSEAFQKRIHRETKQRVDHSTAGAKEKSNRYANIGRISQAVTFSFIAPEYSSDTNVSLRLL